MWDKDNILRIKNGDREEMGNGIKVRLAMRLEAEWEELYHREGGGNIPEKEQRDETKKKCD